MKVSASWRRVALFVIPGLVVLLYWMTYGRSDVRTALDSPSGERGAPETPSGEHAVRPIDGSLRSEVSSPVPGGAAVVSGAVLTASGPGLEGVEVRILSRDESPFGGDPTLSFNDLVGGSVHTDSEGRFEARLAPEQMGKKVLVLLRKSPHFEVEVDRHWVEVPSEGVDFDVRVTRPLTVTAELVAEGAREFTLQVEVPREEIVVWRRSHDGIAKAELREAYAGMDLVATMRLEDQKGLQPQRFTLPAGGQRHLFFYAEGQKILGRVVAEASGAAVAGAKVMLGPPSSFAGDEPLEVPDYSSVPGVLTDDRGEFRIWGKADAVTAWHPDYSAGSAPVQEEGVEIALGALGALGGIVEASALVVLDEVRTSAADQDGHFAFHDVAAGLHWLEVGAGNVYGVTVSPGERCDLGRLTDRYDAEVLIQGVETFPDTGYLFFVGREPDRGYLHCISTVVRWGEAAVRAHAHQYTVLGMGYTGYVQLVPGPNNLGDLEFAAVEVTARAGSDVALLLAEEYPTLRQFADRVSVTVPPDGVITFHVTGPGLYRAWSVDGDAEADVVARNSTVRVDLRN